jgi:hypothetical protein
LLCDPHETTANGKRLVVEDSAACLKTIQTPVAQQVLKTDGAGNLTWTNGANNTVLAKSSTGIVEFNQVQTAYIADSAVTTAKINDSAVTTAKIADSSVTTVKIVDANITTAKLVDSSVTTAKIADNSITTAKLVDLAVTTAKINNASVTPAKLSETYLKTSDFTGANQSISGNGWQSIPGGLIIQWGQNNSATEVIFPKVFPNTVLSFTATPIQGSPTQATVQLDTTWNASPTTKVNIYKTGGAPTMAFTWIAIGW